MKQQRNGLGVQVVLGICGFFLAGVLSLTAGNTMMTSLMRGAVGCIGLFLLGIVFQFAFRAFVGLPQEEVRGKHIDLLLPELPLETASSSRATTARKSGEEDDFVPLADSLKPASSNLMDHLSEMDPAKLAEALRHLDD